MMIVFAMHRIELHRVQRVVHPAHIPFVMESQPAGVRRPGDAGKRGGHLCHGDRAVTLRADGMVDVAQKGDGLQIFIAAKKLGTHSPAARL